MPQAQSRQGDGARRVHHEDHRDHEGWGRGIGCRVFACLAALRAGPTEHGLPEECFSQRRKVAKGMARVGFSTKDTKVTKGGVTDDEELIAKR